MTTSNTLTKTDLANILNEIVAIDGTDMTSQEIEDFVDSLNVTGIHAVDYIVEQGTENGWTYRKWNSGIGECWGTKTGTWSVNTSATAYGGYRSALLDSDNFPFTFTAIPHVTAVCSNGNAQGAFVSHIEPYTTKVSWYFAAGSSLSAATRACTLHAVGYWK